jgi:hypothetical protein
MKTVLPISRSDPVAEAQRLLAVQMHNPPKYGVISIKAVYHGGTCRRIEIKRKSAIQLDTQQEKQAD